MESAAVAAAVAEAVSYAACHGIVVVSGGGLQHAPMTLRPSPVDRACHAEAVRLAPALNAMLRAVARDTSFLRAALAETASADPFTARLLALMPDEARGPELAIVRYDYFVHAEHGRNVLRMVEMNTIAASFAALGTKVGALHRHLAAHPAARAAEHAAASKEEEEKEKEKELPRNDALAALAAALAAAHATFAAAHAGRFGDARPAALMVVQPGERNAFDQDALRFALWDLHGVEMRRVSLREIHLRGRVDGGGFLRLALGGPVGGSAAEEEEVEEEVVASVVYFRAGYTPRDYPSAKEWGARALIERSNAAACPSVAMQLAGTKKVQQLLDAAGTLERFACSASDAAAMRRTFARQWSLSAAEGGAEVARMAVERPDGFVLKPQREGGGNNLYGGALRDALVSMTAEQRAAFVLMERIRPPAAPNVLLRDGVATPALVVSELGVYGVLVADAHGAVVRNAAAGTLLRSKAASQEDGGVAAGVAVLDSPRLVN